MWASLKGQSLSHIFGTLTLAASLVAAVTPPPEILNYNQPQPAPVVQLQKEMNAAKWLDNERKRSIDQAHSLYATQSVLRKMEVRYGSELAFPPQMT